MKKILIIAGLIILVIILGGVAVWAWDYFNPEEWKGSAEIEIVDESGFVGMDSCIAVDSQGNPHASYYDHNAQHLKHAWKDDSGWHYEEVDQESSDNGEDSSIQLDSQDNPHIVYVDTANGALKYAKFNGSSWETETVIQFIGGKPIQTSLALDQNDYPHISYSNQPENALGYSYWDGQNWHHQNPFAEDNLSVDTSIALDSKDYPHMAFTYEGKKEAPKHVYWDGGNWQVETIDSGTESGEDVEIAIDSNDRVYIAYRDYAQNDVKLAKWDGSAWKTEVAAQGDKGMDLDLALDSNGQPHIVYGSKDTFVRITWFDGREWVQQSVEKIPNGDTSIAIDQDNHYHLSYTWEKAEESKILKYATGVPQEETPPKDDDDQDEDGEGDGDNGGGETCETDEDCDVPGNICTQGVCHPEDD